MKKDEYNLAKRLKREALKPPPALVVPDRLHELLGPVITLPKEREDWSDRHVKQWSELSPVTQRQYLKTTQSFLGVEVESATQLASLLEAQNPFVIVDQILSKPTPATRNQLAKSLFGILNASTALTNSKTTALLAKVIQPLSSLTKKEVGDLHKSQVIRPEMEEKVPEWKQLSTLTSKFIRSATLESPWDVRKQALTVALYTLIPPIRCDWASVSLNASSDDNWIESSPVMIVHWNQFKNKESFPDGLHQIITGRLEKIIRRWLRNLKCKWLIPVSNDEESAPYSNSEFGRFLADTIESITGQRSGVQALRISYIRNLHKRKEFTVEQMEAEMELLHQKSLATHLSYRK